MAITRFLVLVLALGILVHGARLHAEDIPIPVSDSQLVTLVEASRDMTPRGSLTSDTSESMFDMASAVLGTLRQEFHGIHIFTDSDDSDDSLITRGIELVDLHRQHCSDDEDIENQNSGSLDHSVSSASSPSARQSSRSSSTTYSIVTSNSNVCGPMSSLAILRAAAATGSIVSMIAVIMLVLFFTGSTRDAVIFSTALASSSCLFCSLYLAFTGRAPPADTRELDVPNPLLANSELTMTNLAANQRSILSPDSMDSTPDYGSIARVRRLHGPDSDDDTVSEEAGNSIV